MDEAKSKEQVELAEQLQIKWLKRMNDLFDAGTITSTDMATLARVLMMNGWSLDPAKLPEKLKDKLLNKIRYDDDLTDEERRKQKLKLA